MRGGMEMNKGLNPNILFKKNDNGALLAWHGDSGVSLLEEDGLFFKDLSKDGVLHPYEDWRLPPKERAKDLAARMSVEQIAGLMLYGLHQTVPGEGNPFMPVLYGGKAFSESGADVSDLSDGQIEALRKEEMRHLLIAQVSGASDAARWNNNLQALAESLPLGIPVAIGTDPRHGNDNSKEFNAGSGGDISAWPEELGLAASFDPGLVRRFGEIAAKEYRALGITSALSPQADLATEPRWFRFSGTFGESAHLAADMARAYIDGMQTSGKEARTFEGWGSESVAAMVKHWPGGGCGEGGRDAHFAFGKYSVFPGGNLQEHLKPFTEGAFELKDGTKKAAAVMPYYTVPFDQDSAEGENVGCSYSKYLITDLLRETYGYDGVVCTDWGITTDQSEIETVMTGKCWGAEDLTQAQRCLKILMAGVDQFGGLSEKAPVLEAYRLGIEIYGEERMRLRFEQSAVRILTNLFLTGLFENPYVDPEQSDRIAGCAEFMQEGFEAQVKSVILLKNNDGVLPLKKNVKVYIPKMFTKESRDWFGNIVPEHWDFPTDRTLAEKYLTLAEQAEDADCALVFLHAPDGLNRAAGGYSVEDRKNGGNGYVPISLQYRPYTAKKARGVSIAGGDPREQFMNRSFQGKTVTVNNESDLDILLETKERMGNKPVIAVMASLGPVVVSEFEEKADALLLTIGDLHQAVLEIITGKKEPSGLLPFQIPADMDTVEMQQEDVAFDMRCHSDTEGNCYDFAYGMNWGGLIEDERTRKYGRG